MKKILLILTAFAIVLSCADEKVPEPYDRFWESLTDAGEIGQLERLTDDGRFIYPFFAPGDSVIIFKRLLAPDAETAVNLKDSPIASIMGININTKEIFSLSKYPLYPSIIPYMGENYQAPLNERITMAILSPDSTVIAFETMIDEATQQLAIYLAKDDSVTQLSYGLVSCFIERFSHSGRYLTAVIENEPSWILIYDLETGKIYKLENPDRRFEYKTVFSSDDKMITFISSEKLVANAGDYFGDIWLFRFNQ